MITENGVKALILLSVTLNLYTVLEVRAMDFILIISNLDSLH